MTGTGSAWKRTRPYPTIIRVACLGIGEGPLGDVRPLLVPKPMSAWERDL